MKAFAWLLAATLPCVALAAQEAAAGAPQGKSPKPFDAKAFAAYSQQRGATAEQVAAFTKAAEDGATQSGAEKLLRLLSPAYDKGCELQEKDSPEAALELAKLITGTKDEREVAFARYRLARALLAGDDPEAALEELGKYLKGDPSLAPFEVDAAYYHAHALAKVPLIEAAKTALKTFLQAYAETAPERYLAVAKQQLQELDMQGEIPLYEVADKLKGAERGIKKTDTGEKTQEKQRWALAKLEELIKLAEEQEKQQSGAPSGNQRSNSPAGVSKAPPGAARIGELHKAPTVADRWGMMKDADRKAIENDAATKLPPGYSRMLEEYYKRLGKGGR